MVDSMIIIKIHGNNKYTGQRIARSVEKINALKWRVILANGTKIFVEDVTIIRNVQED